MTKVLFFHNIVAPYRTPLFNHIAKKVDLEVCFLNIHDKDRMWDQSDRGFLFKYFFSQSVNFKVLGKKLSLNIDILRRYSKANFDVVIFLDDPENIVSMFAAIFYFKFFKRTKVILISPRFRSYVSVVDGFFSSVFKRIIDVFRFPMYFMADRIWCYSKETKNILSKYVSEKKLIVGFQGYPEQDVKLYLTEQYFQRKFDSKEIIYLGYLNKRKGVDVLIKAFNVVKSRGLKLNLKIIGDGEYRAEIEAATDSSIQMMGYIGGLEKYTHIQNSMFLCLPSHSDSWGWVVQESHICATPVITTRQVVAREILPSQDYVYESANVDNLVDIFTKISELSYLDYCNLCLASHESSKEHTIKKAMDSFDEIMRNL